METFETIDWESFDEALPPPAKSPVLPTPTPGAPASPAPGTPAPAGKPGAKGKVAGLPAKDAFGAAVSQTGVNPDEIMGAMTPRHDVDDILDEVIKCLKSADTQQDQGSLDACLAVAEHYMTIVEFLGQNVMDQKKAQFDAQLQLMQHQQQMQQSDQEHQAKLKAQSQQLQLQGQVAKKMADQKLLDTKAMSAHRMATQKTKAATSSFPPKAPGKPVATKKPTEEMPGESPGQGSLFSE